MSGQLALFLLKITVEASIVNLTNPMKMKLFYGLMAAIAAPVAYSQITINEIDADTPGTDTMEFIELYDGGVGNTSLDGLVLVLVNGAGESPYDRYDLDTFSTNAEGYFVIGNLAGAGLAFANSSNEIQNSAEAVALYTGDASDFPNGTAVTTANLVDVVLHTSDGTADVGLISIFGGFFEDETANGDSATESIQRVPDGASTFIVDVPTPGSTNELDPLIELILDPSIVDEGDGSGAILATVVVPDIVTAPLTLSVSISDGTELSGPVSVTIPSGDDFVEFDLNAVEDSIVDGVQTVEVRVSATDYRDGVASANVTDNDLSLPQVVINEMQVRAEGSNPQFVELYNNEGSSVDIAGWSVRVFESDASESDFGAELGSFVIPSGSPINLSSGGFYLAGNMAFESVYGIAPDLQVEPDFTGSDITMILFDSSDNAVYTVFSRDSGSDGQANNAGGVAIPDLTIGPDGFASPAGYILDADGGASASEFEFSEFPASLATPGTTNTSLLSRLRIESSPEFFSEGDGVGAATATITRINDTAGMLTVYVVSSDTSEVTVQSSTVIFADGEDERVVLLDAVDESDIDGIQSVVLTARATGFIAGTEEITVTDDDTPIANLVINEMTIDTPGGDSEFIEIYNAGSVAVDLAGYSFERWESDDIASFGSQDSGGAIMIPTGSPVMIEAGGYYLMGNANFQAAYPAVTVDLVVTVSLENSSTTFVLRDTNGNVVHSVFATDGDAEDVANINGVAITPDAIGNAEAFALLPDGDSNNVISISNAVPSSEATPGASNGIASAYEVSVASCSASGGEFVINFTATGSSDVYVTSDLQNWVIATNGEGVATGTYTDTAPPAERAFYLIQEAGEPAP